jgi:hypothetical protein
MSTATERPATLQHSLTVDPEFRALIPPLSEEEAAGLGLLRRRGGSVPARGMVRMTNLGAILARIPDANDQCEPNYSITHHPDVQAAVRGSLVVEYPERYRQAFELVRCLKRLPALADAEPADWEEIARLWYDQAPAKSRIRDGPFEEALIDVVRARKSCKYGKGEGPMAAIVKRAEEAPEPLAAQRYEQPKLRLLVKLCAELQKEAGYGAPFFLGVRAAAAPESLDVNIGTASRWLELLQFHGVLRCVEKGTLRTRQATEWRYVPFAG